MYETFLTIAKLFGGLALFIYGMTFMGDGLQKAAGDKLKSILALLTRNPFTGVLAGTLVTMILQSSSATTVMVVGFVGAGLLTLKQSISVILGANIGTTITAQIVAFDVGELAYLFAAVGFILFFFIGKKGSTLKSIGQIIFAFGVLFIGLTTMSESMKPLAATPAFEQLMLSVSDVPILGLVVGTVATCILQSSSATIAILQNLATQTGADGAALLTLTGAIPILLGSNIGTTITAFFSSLGAKTQAKRAALSHTIFNFFTSILFMFLIRPYAWMITKLPSAVSTFLGWFGAEVDIETGIMREIANAHTLFNILGVVIWIPFIGLLAKVVTLIYKDKPNEIEKTTLYITDKVSPNTTFALDLANKELSRMADFTKTMLGMAVESFINYDEAKIEKVNEIEDVVDIQQNSMIRYLSRLLAEHSMTSVESMKVTRLMKATSDIERVGDYAVNITESAQIKHQKKLPFSEQAYTELTDSFAMLNTMLDNCISALKTDDRQLAEKVVSDEDKVDQMEKRLRASHLERLHKGLCDPESAITYIELLHHMERIGDHCNNVAQAVLGREEHETL